MLCFVVAKALYVLLVMGLLTRSMYAEKIFTSKLDSNPVPSACEARALTSELLGGVHNPYMLINEGTSGLSCITMDTEWLLLTLH